MMKMEIGRDRTSEEVGYARFERISRKNLASDEHVISIIGPHRIIAALHLGRNLIFEGARVSLPFLDEYRPRRAIGRMRILMLELEEEQGFTDAGIAKADPARRARLGDEPHRIVRFEHVIGRAVQMLEPLRLQTAQPKSHWGAL